MTRWVKKMLPNRETKEWIDKFKKHEQIRENIEKKYARDMKRKFNINVVEKEKTNKIVTTIVTTK